MRQLIIVKNVFIEMKMMWRKVFIFIKYENLTRVFDNDKSEIAGTSFGWM